MPAIVGASTLHSHEVLRRLTRWNVVADRSQQVARLAGWAAAVSTARDRDIERRGPEILRRCVGRSCTPLSSVIHKQQGAARQPRCRRRSTKLTVIAISVHCADGPDRYDSRCRCHCSSAVQSDAARDGDCHSDNISTRQSPVRLTPPQCLTEVRTESALSAHRIYTSLFHHQMVATPTHSKKKQEIIKQS